MQLSLLQAAAHPTRFVHADELAQASSWVQQQLPMHLSHESPSLSSLQADGMSPQGPPSPPPSPHPQVPASTPQNAKAKRPVIVTICRAIQARIEAPFCDVTERHRNAFHRELSTRFVIPSRRGEHSADQGHRAGRDVLSFTARAPCRRRANVTRQTGRAITRRWRRPSSSVSTRAIRPRPCRPAAGPRGAACSSCA